MRSTKSIILAMLLLLLTSGLLNGYSNANASTNASANTKTEDPAAIQSEEADRLIEQYGLDKPEYLPSPINSYLWNGDFGISSPFTAAVDLVHLVQGDIPFLVWTRLIFLWMN